MTVKAGVVAFRIGNRKVDIEAGSVKTNDGKPTKEDLMGETKKVGSSSKANAASIEATIYMAVGDKRSDLMVDDENIQVEYSDGSTETLSGAVDYVGERDVDRSKNTFAGKWSGATLKEVSA